MNQFEYELEQFVIILMPNRLLFNKFEKKRIKKINVVVNVNHFKKRNLHSGNVL